MIHRCLVDVQLLKHLVIALKDLDGVPSLLFLGQTVNSRLFDMCQRMLDHARKGVHRNGLAVLRSIDRCLGSLHDARALQCGDLNDLAAELTGQLRRIDSVAVLLDDIHHINGEDDRDTKLGKLCRQVQVTLEVGTVDDVEDGVGTLINQVVSRDDFLQRVGGQRIDTGKVGDNHAVVLLQLTFFFLNRNARPVTDELVRAGQCVEQRGFTAVRVAGKGNSDFHV